MSRNRTPKPEPVVVIHIGEGYAPIIEPPFGIAPDELLELSDAVARWWSDGETLAITGAALRIYDHRQDGPADHLAAVADAEVIHR